MDQHDAISQLATQLANLFMLVALAFGAALASAMLTAINTWMAKIQGRKLDHNTNVTECAAVMANSADKKAAEAVQVNKQTTAEIKHAVNGQQELLIEAARKEGHATGVVEGSNLQEDVKNRLTSIEDKHEVLSQGQIEIKKAVDNLIVEVRKQSKF